jgi:energy-coupling factor transporter ATP-binding protein EcfA2
VIKIAQLTPKPTERLAIFGQSGSGKTTLIRQIIEPLGKYEPVIVIDTKPEWEYRKWWQLQSKEKYQALPTLDVRRLKPGWYVYRPPTTPEWADPGLIKICLTALKRLPKPKNDLEPGCTLVFDEFADISHGPTPAPHISKVIRQGRSKHVRLILGSQRPATIPLIGITEAIKLIALRLKSDDDRKRLAQWVDPHMREKPGPGRHDFWLKDDSLDNEVVMLIHQK